MLPLQLSSLYVQRLQPMGSRTVVRHAEVTAFCNYGFPSKLITSNLQNPYVEGDNHLLLPMQVVKILLKLVDEGCAE
jgi:hypothetical protein